MRRPEPQPATEALRVDLQVLERKGIPSHDVEAELPVAFLETALSDTDASVKRQGKVTLTVLVQPDRTILVRGRLAAAFEVPCARCLEPAAVDAGDELCITYVPDGHERALRVRASDEDPEGVPLEEEDLDLYVYRGHVIDLAPMVAESVAVAYPMRALCPRGVSCRGLCTGCGSDLNQLDGTADSCAGCGLPLYEVSHAEADRAKAPEQRQDSPWQAALRKLRED